MAFVEAESIRCACGRMDHPAYTWLCRCCFLEKEIGYALTELDRPDVLRWRLGRLVSTPWWAP